MTVQPWSDSDVTDPRQRWELVRESERQYVTAELMRISRALSPHTSGEYGVPLVPAVKAHVDVLRLLGQIYQLSHVPDLPARPDVKKIPLETAQKMIEKAVAEAVEAAVESERVKQLEGRRLDLEGSALKVRAELSRVSRIQS